MSTTALASRQLPHEVIWKAVLYRKQLVQTSILLLPQLKLKLIVLGKLGRKQALLLCFLGSNTLRLSLRLSLHLSLRLSLCLSLRLCLLIALRSCCKQLLPFGVWVDWTASWLRSHGTKITLELLPQTCITLVLLQSCLST